LRKIVLAAVAMSPLFGGMAMAGGWPGDPPDFTQGPMAYPDWQARWAQYQGPDSAGWLVGHGAPQRSVRVQPTSFGTPAQGATQPNG